MTEIVAAKKYYYDSFDPMESVLIAYTVHSKAV